MEVKFDILKNRIHSDANDLKESYNTFNDQETESINLRCDKLMEDRFAKYSEVAKQFTKYFSEDSLSLSLERKADIYMLDRLDDRKVDKKELSTF